MRWTRKNRQKKKLKISWIEFEIVENDGLRKNTKKNIVKKYEKE